MGTLVATNERIDGALEPSINHLQDWLKETQPNIHADETPWMVRVRASQSCLTKALENLHHIVIVHRSPFYFLS